MTQYIDKAALVAEIEKLKAYLQIPNAQLEATKVCDNVISVIDTLEVKSERAGTEDILNELASRIKSAEIVNVRQVLEWINEQTKK